MRALSTIESQVIFWVDTGSSRAAILRNMGEGYDDDVEATIASLVSEGILTSSELSDWLVVTEWMPKTAEKMRAGLR